MADRKILLSDAWLNDRIMDAAQQLICKELGIEYQSVLNVQKKFRAVDDEHVQLLHDGSDNWFLSFCSSGRVQICDSLRPKLSRESMKCVKSLFKHCVDHLGRHIVTFLPVRKQPDGYNCGPFAIVFAAEIIDGKSPMDVHFDVCKMRKHLTRCLEDQSFTPFTKVSSAL